MRIDHPERIAEMVVCGDCRDVVGPFYRLYGTLAGQGPLKQRGTCAGHPPRPRAPTWPRFDFNRGVDLCYCCGIEPLTSGSKYSVWFCDICRPMVMRLNAVHQRCIIPLGRHSVHYGWLLRAEDVDDPVTTHRFSEASRAAAVATRALADWYRIVIGSNLEAIGAADGPPMPIIRYWRNVAYAVDRADRFGALCDYLDRRGRAEIEERNQALPPKWLGPVQELVGRWRIGYADADGMIADEPDGELDLRPDGSFDWQPEPTWLRGSGSWGLELVGEAHKLCFETQNGERHSNYLVLSEMGKRGTFFHWQKSRADAVVFRDRILRGDLVAREDAS